MNCKKCGHLAERHERWEDSEMRMEYGCQDCSCSRTFTEIKLDAWKTEALAAREYIKMLERYMGAFFGDDSSFTIEEMEKELEAYLTAKVKDTTP